jgi:predicted N-acetyltransferase YhbS
MSAHLGNPVEAIVLREPCEADAPAVARLVDQLGYPTYPAEIVRRLDRLAANLATHAVVAVDRGTAIGVGVVHFIDILEGDRPLAALVMLIVDDAHRGRGVGTALIRELEREAEARGSFAISVHSGRHRVGAHAFYRHLGYELTGERIRKLLGPVATG